MLSATALSTTIDFERDGRQSGYVRVPLAQPWEGHRELRLPIVQFKRGEGPTVLLTAGTHGDEHVGPLVLGRLVRQIRPEQVSGRVMILPTLNLPAVLHRRRTSPLDGGDLNRAYPGNGTGTPTERIAHFVDLLFGHCDAAMDLHTGGKALQILPTTMTVRADDAAQAKRIHAAATAFGAPLNIELPPDLERPTASRRATARGLTYVGCEMGGGAPVTPDLLHLCERGLRNLLAHLALLPPPPASERPPGGTRFTRKWGFRAEVTASAAGVFVPNHPIGTEVREGQPAGQLYFPTEPARAPELMRYPASGLLAAQHATSGVRQGDVLYWLVKDMD